ncbi:MAG: type II toxin-antitoxin system RelE/ParE family toxin [Betaproteobacteria bacterium]
MRIRVEEYLLENESSPYRKWFDGLDAGAAAKVSTALVRLETGNTSSIKWFSGIGEIRIDWGPGYRVYLAKDGESLVIIFGGGTKKTQQNDIEKAIALYSEFKRRKKAGAARNTKR